MVLPAMDGWALLLALQYWAALWQESWQRGALWNNFQKLSDHKWDEISKDEKLSLLEQTKGLVPSIDQLKTLEQPIRVITKAES